MRVYFSLTKIADTLSNDKFCRINKNIRKIKYKLFNVIRVELGPLNVV